MLNKNTRNFNYISKFTKFTHPWLNETQPHHRITTDTQRDGMCLPLCFCICFSWSFPINITDNYDKYYCVKIFGTKTTVNENHYNKQQNKSVLFCAADWNNCNLSHFCVKEEKVLANLLPITPDTYPSPAAVKPFSCS